MKNGSQKSNNDLGYRICRATESIFCKHDWEAWKIRLNATIWRLKEAIEWICQPQEWGSVTFFKKDIPNDVESYKKSINIMVVNAINQGDLNGKFDPIINDYYVFPLQFLSFLRTRVSHVFLPFSCQCFLKRAADQELYLVATRSVKRQKIKTPRHVDRKPGRYDSNQNMQLSEAVKKACEERGSLFNSYSDLLQYPPVKKIIDLMTDAKGRPRSKSVSTLKRLLSDFVTSEAKNPGCRSKKQ